MSQSPQIVSNAAGRELHQTSALVEDAASTALFRMSNGVSRKVLRTVNRFCCVERHSPCGKFNLLVVNQEILSFVRVTGNNPS